jgi:MFS family permease
MNLALGTLYAWSVFVAPLEKQFGWKRADTSMVFTIAVMVFALTFVVAGRIQDKIGPLYCSLAGGVLVSLGFFLCFLHHQPDVPVYLLRGDRRPGQRLRLLHADSGDGQMVPR